MNLLEKLDNFGASIAARMQLSVSQVSGTVTNNGSPIASVHVYAGGGSNQYFNTAITDANGEYTFHGMADGITSVITPVIPGVTFEPASTIVKTPDAGGSVTGIDFAGTGTVSIGLLTTTFLAKDFEVGGKGDGLEKAAEWINYYCSGGGNGSLASLFLTQRLGSVQLSVVLSSTGTGLGLTGDFYLNSFELLHDGHAAQKITDWFNSFNQIIDANHYSVPSVAFFQTYSHSNSVYLVIGVYRSTENSAAPNPFPPFQYTVDIFSGEQGAAEIESRLNEKYSETGDNYYYNFDWAPYWTSWSTDTMSGCVIIGQIWG